MHELKNAIVVVIACTVVLGLAYPLAMTGAAQLAFGGKADGDPALIGQDFSRDRSLFQSRPSATDYAADATAFPNLGPNQRDLAERLRDHAAAYLERERPYTPGLTVAGIPPDAVTTSASGVDPHISEANARIQANRVARERGLERERVLELVDQHAGRPLLGLAGEKSVNVLTLNRALEREAR
jgi:K+-transporting ATPase ATPase C chain